MEKSDVLDLKVGQLAEMKSFVRGFRGAWFRCEIRDVNLKKNKILPEYYDFSDEEITWGKIYEMPHYGRKSNHIKKQLMMRPRYPLMYHKSEMPPVNSISEVCVIINGAWKVGDLVDWYEDSCFWSARVIKVLSDDKVQIELPMSPAGEGGTHEAFCKDLRPSLDWSAGKGWTLATMEGQSSSTAQLIFPSIQDEVNCTDSERDEVETVVGEASSTSRISAAGPAIEGDTERPTSEKPQENGILNSQDVKMEDCGVTGKGAASSSDSISTTSFHVDDVVGSEEGVDIELNIMHEDTLEATILDLEELVNRVKWIKTILETNQDTTSSAYWKFQS